MFNTENQDSNPENIWNLLGTFFDLLPETSKKKFEVLFEGLSRLNSGLFYNLFQNEKLKYFQESNGWYEILFEEFNLIIENQNTPNLINTKKVFLNPPVNIQSSFLAGANNYFYKITSLNSEGESLASEEVFVSSGEFPVTLTWPEVEGAVSYNLYGRNLNNYHFIGNVETEEFVDDGLTAPDTQISPPKVPTAIDEYLFTPSNPFIYLFIPTLETENGEVLNIGENYFLDDFKKIRIKHNSISTFINNQNNVKWINLTAPSSLIISPMISSIYWESFNINLREILLKNNYKPLLKDYELLNELDKILAWGDHIKYFTWALSYFLRRRPTIRNIEKALSISLGYPFAYEEGEVTEINGSIIKIGEISYDIGVGTQVFSEGDYVSKFDILCEPVILHDWISNPNLIESMVNIDLIEPRICINIDYNENYSFDEKVFNFVKDAYIPDGLKYVE